MVSVDGAETKVNVNIEGEAPGIPTVLEWPVAMPVNTVANILGAEFYAAGCERCAGMFHINLSAAPVYVAPLRDAEGKFVAAKAEEPAAPTPADPEPDHVKAPKRKGTR